MPDIFLSYSREDQATARRFADAFAAEGFEVWWDATLRSGEAYDEVTEKALREARAVVVLWSKVSVQSRWVRAEATLADRSKTLAPLMIEPCERPIMFELTQTADLSHWKGEARDRVWLAFLEDVRRLTGVRSAPQPAPDAVRAASKDSRPGILVIPFVNMSGDAEQEYFSDGVSEDIITDLGKVAALSVVSRNTAFTFKGRTVAAAHLARELGVSHILEGSVRKSGQRVRITAQLLAAASDTQVWAERYDRTLDDIFAIQDEISQAIVAALKLRLAPDEKAALGQKPTSSTEAYELYLMARQFNRTRGERMKPAIVRICRRAVELDPNFARAWALMASAQSEAHQRGVWTEDGREAAERAVMLDPALPEAHATLGEVMVRRGEFDAAKGHIETALRLDPESYDGHIVAGYRASAKRDFHGAVKHFEKAITLEEHAWRAAGLVVQFYGALGEKENALAASRRTLAMTERMLQTEPDNGSALSFFITSLAMLGEVGRARDWVERAMLLDPDNVRMVYNIACAMAEIKDADTAIRLLDSILDRITGGYLRWIANDSSFDPVRDNPAFIAWLAKARAKFGIAD